MLKLYFLRTICRNSDMILSIYQLPVSLSLYLSINYMCLCPCIYHCATSRKIAVSIPDVVIRIFHFRNPFGRTMALGSTQPLTEMSTRDVSLGGKGGRCVGLTTLPPSCADCLEILGASTSWSPKGSSRSVLG